MERMKRLSSILMTGLLCTLVAAQEDIRLLFDSANSAYQDGNYTLAIEGYENILSEHMHFESEYNLGNAYFKTQSWGPAILHYERAARLSPGNSDLKANLTLANAQVKDRIESLPSNGILDVWDRIVAPGRFRLWMLIMVLTWTLGFVALAWRIWSVRLENRRILGTSAAVLLVMGALSAVLVASTSQRIETSKAAIVMATESSVRNEPGASGMTLFMLHEGTKVTVLQRSETHWRIQLANGNVGWMTAEDLSEI